MADSSSTQGVLAVKKRASKLSEFVLKRLPGAVRYRDHPVPYELRFMLPLAARPDFGAFLGDLEASSADLHLDNYGISMAPFEEVCWNTILRNSFFFRTASLHPDEYGTCYLSWHVLSGLFESRQ
jgi:hypothetical protein